MKQTTRKWDKVVSLVLGLVTLAVIGSIVYLTATPKIGDRFTEFYILGPGSKAEGYPRELMVGEEARVLVGIVNHEYEELSYQLEVTVKGVTHKRINRVVLGHKEKWEQEVSFTPVNAGENQSVEFLLYRYGVTQPYRTLRLWIDVKEEI